jgi:hypothetical protein
MSAKAERQAGTTVDGWSLERLLGVGGNGEVWKASRAGVQAAVKLLKSAFAVPGNKRFARFRDEATMQRHLAADHPGVLPLLDSSIPDEPSPQLPVWLATPIAVPVTAALKDQPLGAAVEAVAAFAETLAGLHARCVYHRDIKPNNLYRYGERWVLGDLGLVDFPEKEDLTDTAERLGPRNYLAPEMLGEAKRSDGAKADVYSLAKTLWVLGTEQRVPPGGELRVENSQLSIGGYRPHPRVRQLDLLVERATQHDPEGRPSMRGFADELQAWLRPLPPGAIPDTADILARVKAQGEPAVRAAQIRHRQQHDADKTVSWLDGQMKPIADALSKTGLYAGRVEHAQVPDSIYPQQRTLDTPPQFWQHWLYTKAEKPGLPTSWSSRGLDWLTFACLVGLELRTDGNAWVGGGYLIQSQYGAERIGWSQHSHPIGSAAFENAVVTMINHLNGRLPQALERFLTWMETGKPPQS